MERTRKKKIASRGVIVFAFNSSKYNYAEMAVYTARRIESFLGLPTTLVTDTKSFETITNNNLIPKSKCCCWGSLFLDCFFRFQLSCLFCFLKNQLFLSVVELEVFSEMELVLHLMSVNQKEAQLLDLVLQGT